MRKEDLNPDPLIQFKLWFEEAVASGIILPEAMALATVTKDGKPAVRMILQKGIEHGGVVFFTNYNSPKAKQLSENPYAEAVFFWDRLQRQVRIEGRVEKISEEESDQYWRTRPRDSQIAGSVSNQSQILESREVLEKKFEDIKKRVGEGEIPRPKFWGGYCLMPEKIEFWQGMPNRMHDRFLYIKKGDQWQIVRLAP